MGKVGGAAARAFARLGCRVVGVSDISTGLYDPSGLDIEDLLDHIDASSDHLLSGYTAPGVETVAPAQVLELPVDVLVPAALEGQLNAGNADRIQADLIVEGANGPTTSGADKILADRGVTIVPDILANAGGVVVSHAEWVQNLQGMSWDLDQVNAYLDGRMTDAFASVWTVATEQGIDMRTAAYLRAVKATADAIMARGGL
jgi:glutamate dehydrogenase/leucine dehydrogenase